MRRHLLLLLIFLVTSLTVFAQDTAIQIPL